MPRRYIDYPEGYEYWNYLSSMGAFHFFCIVLYGFLLVMLVTLTSGKRCGDNPWGGVRYYFRVGQYLSPPPEHTFFDSSDSEVDSFSWLSRCKGVVMPFLGRGSFSLY